MNNRWLGLFIPKVEILIPTLAEIKQIRAKKVIIYRMRAHEDGFLVLVGRNHTEGYEMSRRYSIYPAIFTFILPLMVVWTLFTVLNAKVTIGYEVRGNLNEEKLKEVQTILKPHFREIGPFSFVRNPVDEIVGQLKENFHEYIWIDINQKGSNLVIDIYDTSHFDQVERLEVSETIYATRSGVVTKIDAKSCLVLVEPNQLVKAGDPLITCFTPTGFGTEFAPIDGEARGDVFAEVWYEVVLNFEREYLETMLTSNVDRQWFVNIGAQGASSLRIWGADTEFEDYERRTTVYNPLFFLKNSPLTFENVHYYEKRDIIMVNEIEQISDNIEILVRRELDARCENSPACALSIINLEPIEVVDVDGMVTIRYHATLLENIATRGD